MDGCAKTKTASRSTTAKYGIMLPLSHDETLSFDMELPKHTTLIDLHDEYTPDDVVKANLYENVCAAFKHV